VKSSAGKQRQNERPRGAACYARKPMARSYGRRAWRLDLGKLKWS